jgi:Zn-dependent protease
MLSQDKLATMMLGLVSIVISLSIHEFAHAWAAWKLGDDTAQRQGRLTLNPWVHLDPIGSLLLPAILLYSGGFLFGWARPVPFDAARMSRKVRMRTGIMLTALAGPMANVVLALLAALAINIDILTGARMLSAPDGSTLAAFWDLANMMLGLNVMLALFNMVPVPPLDGDKVLQGILPDTLARKYDDFLTEFRQFLPLLLIAVFIGAGSFLAIPMGWLTEALLWLTGGFAV